MNHRTLAFLLLGAAAAQARVDAQTQSLAFTGGVLLNPEVKFSGLGAHPAASAPGPASGSAIDRTYDDGFNRVDDTGNAGATTSAWGYQSPAQLRGDVLVLSSASASGSLETDNAADFINPSANLEYRGSFGPVGNSDWGVLLGVGYQIINADYSGSYITDATVTEDSYDLAGNTPTTLPPAPFSGSGVGDGPRIGSSPARAMRTAGGARVLSGSWNFDSYLLPITGGIYLESQLMGRLNGIVSAGLMGLFVNADFSFDETSTIGSSAAVTSRGDTGSSEILIGAFVQMGIDYALWETASIVASARWQPAESFSHSVNGREVDVNFMATFGVQAGIAFRF